MTDKVQMLAGQVATLTVLELRELVIRLRNAYGIMISDVNIGFGPLDSTPELPDAIKAKMNSLPDDLVSKLWAKTPETLALGLLGMATADLRTRQSADDDDDGHRDEQQDPTEHGLEEPRRRQRRR